MIDFKEVTINDKDIFENYYKEYNPDVSEMTFTNVLMWKQAYGYRYTILNNLLCCIAFSEYIIPFALTPIGNCNDQDFRNAILELKKYFEYYGYELIFKRVSERGLKRFKDNFAENSLEIEYSRDDSDYVYDIEALSALKGKKYHKKRNHISKFMRKYGEKYEYVPIEDKYLDECYRIMEDWCKKRNCDEHRVYGCERLANIEVFKNYNKLDCKGALIKVDGKFEAVAVGEQLNKNTIVIHIEKANDEIDGLYPIINRDLLINEWSDFKYVNREQDLGIEGIRKSKLSYHPDFMIDKFTVRFLG